ncbi:MAG: hypothetical protein SPH71_00115 [Eubacteriales bacterium]|nr:hypothetical protein [Eubacteriales bacterium]
MKKKILAILLVVSMVAALAVGLTACNKDKDKANNAETLGTAIAVAMNSVAETGSVSTDADKDLDSEFTFGGNTVPGLSDAAAELTKYFDKYINNAKAYIKNHDVNVEVEKSDKEGFNFKMTMTVTYKNAKGEDVIEESVIYINAKKLNKKGEVTDKDADINGKDNYAFDAVVMHGEKEFVTIKGTCTYNKDKDAMVFNFEGIGGVNVAVDGVGVNVTAYANEKGGVVVEVDVGVDGACTVKTKVELGKISDTETGAKVYVDVLVGEEGKEGEEIVKVNVVANVTANDKATNLDKNDFAINGTADVTVLGRTIKCTIEGTAKYIPGETEVEEGRYVIKANASLKGSFNF